MAVSTPSCVDDRNSAAVSRNRVSSALTVCGLIRRFHIDSGQQHESYCSCEEVCTVRPQLSVNCLDEFGSYTSTDVPPPNYIIQYSK